MLIIISHDIAWQNLPNPHKSTSVPNPGPLYPAFAIDPWFGKAHWSYGGFLEWGYPQMDGWSGGTPILGNLHIILVKQSQLSKNHIEAQNLGKMDILLNIWPQKVPVSFWAFPLSNKEHFCNQCPSLQRQPAGEELSDVNYGSASFPRCFFGVPFATFQIFQGNPSRFYQPQ